MSLYPDLDDVAAESPVATKELAELRARAKELEREVKILQQWRIAIPSEKSELEAKVNELERERDEARKALLWYGELDCGEALPDFVVLEYESAVIAARAAGESKE